VAGTFEHGSIKYGKVLYCEVLASEEGLFFLELVIWLLVLENI
jgi:hypothetical protein